jgi:hypothetical protein
MAIVRKDRKSQEEICPCTVDPEKSPCSDFRKMDVLCLCADYGMDGHTPG